MSICYYIQIIAMNNLYEFIESVFKNILNVF